MEYYEGLVACLVEGGAERAIMDLLYAKKLLCFTELLDDKIISIRSAKAFEETYLKKGFDDALTIVRILDSRRENFSLSTLYKNKVKIVNVITAPEIEMLIIHHENKYDDFKKKQRQTKGGMKPSEYCKNILGMRSVKSYQFVKEYFSDGDILLEAIKQYKSKANVPSGEKTLLDLLNVAW